jgi:hypothetical protein
MGRFMLVEGFNIRAADQQRGGLRTELVLDNTRDYQFRKWKNSFTLRSQNIPMSCDMTRAETEGFEPYFVHPACNFVP